MRAVVSVATGRYVRGLDRLTEWCAANSEDYVTWRDTLPAGSPTHQQIPYAFKAFALKAAAQTMGYGLGPGSENTTLLWCDASIIPVAPLEPLWERIERDGYWIANNGFTNYTWTADAAYPDLFPVVNLACYPDGMDPAREVNRAIPHVVATSFGVSLAHPTGKAIFEEYYRLASTTKAFRGPWNNPAYVDVNGQPYANAAKFAPCGPSDVRGHRHDQTALSVIAWRLGCKLTDSPDIFAYRGGETEQTVLVADGAY